MKWSAAHPPPLEPPPHLRPGRGAGVWRMAARIWRRHAPVGRVCRECQRPVPCDDVRTYDQVLAELLDYPSGWTALPRKSRGC